MTLQEYQFQRREFNFRSRKSFTRYTPSQWDKKNKEVQHGDEAEPDEDVVVESEHDDEAALDEDVEAEREHDENAEHEEEEAFAPTKGARKGVVKRKKVSNSALRRLRTEGASSPEVPPRRRRGRK